MMPGRSPIFVTLISSIFMFLRDILFRATLEPVAKKGRKKRQDKQKKEA